MKYSELEIGMGCSLDGEACTIVDIDEVLPYVTVQFNDEVGTFLWGKPDETITDFEVQNGD